MHDDTASTAALDRTPLVEQVTRLLQRQIDDGSWPLGSKIPNETELVAWAGVGRNTIREAVGSLAQAGVLRREQGRGTFVTATSDLHGPLDRRVARTSRREVLELRLALDAAAARIAATRRTSADTALLAELLRARACSWRSNDVGARARADTALHTAIIAATHNTLMREVYESLVTVFEEVVLEDVQPDDDHLETEHAELVAAITHQDPERAGRAMSRLLQPLIDQLDAL